MKKQFSTSILNLIIFIGFIGTLGRADAQILNQAVNYNINNTSTIQAGEQIYQARDYIKLLPGFQYNGNGNNSFLGKIDQNLDLQIGILQDGGFQNETPINNNTINTNYEVGSTAGSFEVTNIN